MKPIEPDPDNAGARESKMSNKKSIIAVSALFIACFVFLASCGNKKNTEKEDGKNLVIWTYDSFNSEWGPGPSVSRVFEEKTGIEINWVSHGDAGEMVSRFIREGTDSGTDLILGMDQNLGRRVLDSGLLEEYRPEGAEKIFPELISDGIFYLIPFDYSYFAIVYDSEKISFPPRCLEDLTAPEYERSLILIDPRTSSVGLGFFAWVKECYGGLWMDYWKRLGSSVLTVAEGWSSAYGLFTSGEAPMVLSYTTSPGYHLEYEATERYKAAIFTDGHPLQIETAGLPTSAKNKENARLFLDFMLSSNFQDIIPLTNWMYPVIDIPLPDSFRVNPKSEKTLNPAPVTEEELNEWAAIMRANVRR